MTVTVDRGIQLIWGLTVSKLVTIGVCEKVVELYNNTSWLYNVQRGAYVVRIMITSNKAGI